MQRLIGEAARRTLRALLPYSLYARLARAYGERVSANLYGAREYARLMSLRAAPPGGAAVEFRAPGLPAPVWVRPGSTDPYVFEHSLIREAYACYTPAEPPRFILDAGANAGFTAAWFLSRYAEARLTAVEPDGGNFGHASRNLAAFGDRVRLVRAGVWPKRARLRVVRVDGEGEHGFQVRPAAEGEAFDCEAYDPWTLLEQSGAERIDIFKCDIEGTETALFADAPDRWLSRTKAILIELHNNKARQTVYAACRRHGMREFRYRELHVFHR